MKQWSERREKRESVGGYHARVCNQPTSVTGKSFGDALQKAAWWGEECVKSALLTWFVFSLLLIPPRTPLPSHAHRSIKARAEVFGHHFVETTVLAHIKANGTIVNPVVCDQRRDIRKSGWVQSEVSRGACTTLADNPQENTGYKSGSRSDDSLQF